MSLHPHDPAYSEKSARVQVAEAGLVSAGQAIILLADLVDELRGIIEHLDERIRELEQRPASAQSRDDA